MLRAHFAAALARKAWFFVEIVDVIVLDLETRRGVIGDGEDVGEPGVLSEEE